MSKKSAAAAIVTPASVNQIVFPSIRVDQAAHPFETAFENGTLPKMTAVGFMRTSPDSSTYVSFVVTFQGENVLRIDVDEPNLRAIAEENAKIAFVSNFIDQE